MSHPTTLRAALERLASHKDWPTKTSEQEIDIALDTISKLIEEAVPKSYDELTAKFDNYAAGYNAGILNFSTALKSLMEKTDE